MSSVRVVRLSLRNFKSIEKCALELEPITILVGRNGVGKSNLLDALRFVADSLRNTLEYAIRERGGIDQVRRKSLGGRPTNPAVELDLRLPDGREATYSFHLAAVPSRGFRVHREHCEVKPSKSHPGGAFSLQDGQIVSWSPKSAPPALSEDRLLLVAASGIPEFRPVFDVLTQMTFHNLNPEQMKLPQRPEPGELLVHDGRNLASVVKHLESSNPRGLERVAEYLRAIGIPVTRIEHAQAGVLETVRVAQETDVPTGERNTTFDAIALSDGTIRAMGILVSLLSASGNATGGPSLVGVEEPETALHPAATAALMEALLEGSARTQLLVTCHSPDLLDHELVRPEMIRPVLLEKGKTVVGRLSASKVALIQNHLATAGELLRLDQIEPDPEEVARQASLRGTLWESEG